MFEGRQSSHFTCSNYFLHPSARYRIKILFIFYYNIHIKDKKYVQHKFTNGLKYNTIRRVIFITGYMLFLGYIMFVPSCCTPGGPLMHLFIYNSLIFLVLVLKGCPPFYRVSFWHFLCLTIHTSKQTIH